MTRREMTTLNLELRKEGKQKCTKCLITKNLENFSYKSKPKNLRRTGCRTCVSLSNKTHMKKVLNENPKYYKEKYIKHKDRILKYCHEYRKTHNNYKSTIDRNPTYFSDYSRNKYRTNSDFKFRVLLMNHLKGVSKRKEFKEIWDDIRDVYEMYGITYHIDHLIPREWFKSTTDKELINHVDNLQVIDETYNLSKQNRWSDVVPNDYYQLIKEQIKDEYKDKVEVC